MADFEIIIKENLDCPVCKDMMVGQIIVCERGHSVCYKCKNRIQRCPICKGNLTQIRNICAENLAAIILKPCEYIMYGCTVQSMGDDLIIHEENCKFRPYRCDLPGCVRLETETCEEVEISVADTAEHLLKVHNLGGTIGKNVVIHGRITESEIGWNKFTDTRPQAQFLKCYGSVFVAVATPDMTDSSVNFCICTSWNMLEKYTEYTGNSFKAQITIENENYKLTWQGPVHDSKKTLTEVFQTGACLSLKPSNMLAYCNQNDYYTRSYQVLFSIIKS